MALPLLSLAAMRLLAVAVLLAGCVGEPVDESSTEQEATTAFANDKPAFDFFVAQGPHARSRPPASSATSIRSRASIPTIGAVRRRPGPRHRAVVGRRPLGHRLDDNVARVRGAAGRVGDLAQPPARLHLVRADDHRLRLRAAEGDDERHRRDARVHERVRDLRHVRVVAAHRVRAGRARGVRRDAVLGASYVSQSWPLATMPADASTAASASPRRSC